MVDKALVKSGDFDLFDDDGMMSMMMMMIMMIIMTALIGSATQASVGTANASISPYDYEAAGEVTYRATQATQVLKFMDLIHDPPYEEWNTAYIINDGPYPVEIGINHPHDRFVMLPREGVIVDLTHAKNKIAIIFIVCLPSQNAIVRVTGGY